jgi:TRAP-type uncharacterized transport system fused permease subunit
MPTVGVYVLLATLVAPALVEVGINEIAAHLFILYFGMMSMITPPVAIGAFAAATIAESDAMRTGFAAMRFGWLAFVIPFMFVASPSLLMQGEPMDIAVDMVAAVAATWLISVGIIGYYAQPLALWERAIAVLAGLGLLTPHAAFDGAVEANFVGLIAGALLVAKWIWTGRRERLAARA